MYVPVEKVDATKKLPHEVFDPVRSQTRYRTSLQVHGKVLGHGIIAPKASAEGACILTEMGY